MKSYEPDVVRLEVRYEDLEVPWDGPFPHNPDLIKPGIAPTGI